ncbi:hypothetical protein QJQ45_000548 [Haematococcus lacustris]|nr:hypothetical protein QJQ45_000548 [Haematococcus lacustris]
MATILLIPGKKGISYPKHIDMLRSYPEYCQHIATIPLNRPNAPAKSDKHAKLITYIVWNRAGQQLVTHGNPQGWLANTATALHPRLRTHPALAKPSQHNQPTPLPSGHHKHRGLPADHELPSTGHTRQTNQPAFQPTTHTHRAISEWKKVTYTDGSCIKGTEGASVGAGVYTPASDDRITIALTGDTTINRAELIAILSALLAGAKRIATDSLCSLYQIRRALANQVSRDGHNAVPDELQEEPQLEQHLRSAAFLPWQERRERSDAAARSKSEQRKREYQIRTDSFSQAFFDYLRAIDRLLSMPSLLQQRSDLQAQLPRGAFSDCPIRRSSQVCHKMATSIVLLAMLATSPADMPVPYPGGAAHHSVHELGLQRDRMGQSDKDTRAASNAIKAKLRTARQLLKEAALYQALGSGDAAAVSMGELLPGDLIALANPMSLRTHRHKDILAEIATILTNSQDTVHFFKVRAHSGIIGNEGADALAKHAARHPEQATTRGPCSPRHTEQHAWLSTTSELNVTTPLPDCRHSVRAHMSNKHKLGLANQESIYYQMSREITKVAAKGSCERVMTDAGIPTEAQRTALLYRTGGLYNQKLAMRWGKAADDRCPLCGEADSATHLLSGCSRTAALVQERHNGAGRLIMKAISKGAQGGCIKFADIGSLVHKRSGDWTVDDILNSEDPDDPAATAEPAPRAEKPAPRAERRFTPIPIPHFAEAPPQATARPPPRKERDFIPPRQERGTSSTAAQPPAPPQPRHHPKRQFEQDCPRCKHYKQTADQLHAVNRALEKEKDNLYALLKQHTTPQNPGAAAQPIVINTQPQPHPNTAFVVARRARKAARIQP